MAVSNRFTKDGSLPPPHADLTEQELEAKLVDFLHKDFLQLLNSFKKADKYKIGVMTCHEFRDSVEKCLGYSITDRQWENLKIALVINTDGLVSYPKFLEMFSTNPPGKWNTKEVGGNSVQQVQRQSMNIVDKLKEDSQNDLQNRQKDMDRLKEDTSEQISIELKNKVAKNIKELQKARPDRSLGEIVDIMKEFFKHRFSEADKIFKLMDRRMTGRLSKEQFREILKQCDVGLSPGELDTVWGTFKLGADGMYNFTSIINHFSDFGKSTQPDMEHIPESEKTELPTFTYHGKYMYAYHNVQEQAEKDPEFKDKLKTLREQFNLRTSGQQQPEGNKMSSSQGQTPPQQGGEIFMDIVNKIKPLVHKEWNHLKAIFRHADKHGQAFILGGDMQDIMQMMHFPLNPVEMRRLLRAFDTKKDGHFHYIDFLKVVGGKGSENTFNNQNLANLDKEFQQNIVRDYKNIRRAFKKADPNADGFLTVKQFKNVLKASGFKITPEDLYQILSEFDSSMDGKIYYEEFLSQIMGRTKFL